MANCPLLAAAATALLLMLALLPRGRQPSVPATALQELQLPGFMAGSGGGGSATPAASARSSRSSGAAAAASSSAALLSASARPLPRESASAPPPVAAAPPPLALGRAAGGALDVLAVLLTQATAEGAARRAAQRAGSLPLVDTARFSLGYYYVLTPPRAGDAARAAELAAENATHGDLAFAAADVADAGLSRKVHDELRAAAARAAAPRFVFKGDDDSFVRWDLLLPALLGDGGLAAAGGSERGAGLYWGRAGAWARFHWGMGYVMGERVYRGIAAAALPASCGKNEDECMGGLADDAAVARFVDDARFFNARDEGNRGQASEECWCADWPPRSGEPEGGDGAALLVHHVTPRAVLEWARGHAQLLRPEIMKDAAAVAAEAARGG